MPIVGTVRLILSEDRKNWMYNITIVRVNVMGTFFVAFSAVNRNRMRRVPNCVMRAGRRYRKSFYKVITIMFYLHYFYLAFDI